MEIYQWLLRQNGQKVSETGYWVYANASKEPPRFDAKLEFEMTLIAYQGKADWVDGVLLEIKACADSPEIPEASPDCDYCRYREAAGKALLAQKQKVQPEQKPKVPELKAKKIAHAKASTQTLF